MEVATQEKDELRARLNTQQAGIRAVLKAAVELVCAPSWAGVYGLHLNGDVSPWSELEEGGRFERLSSMSRAREAIAAAEALPHLNRR